MQARYGTALQMDSLWFRWFRRQGLHPHAPQSCTCPLLGTLYKSLTSFMAWSLLNLAGRPSRARNPRSPSPSPSPISSCRGSGVWWGSHPRFAGDRGSCIQSRATPHHHPRFAGDRGFGDHPHPRFPSGVPCPGLCCATPIYASVARFKPVDTSEVAQAALWCLQVVTLMVSYFFGRVTYLT
jgi:hypothetical protein